MFDWLRKRIKGKPTSQSTAVTRVPSEFIAPKQLRWNVTTTTLREMPVDASIWVDADLITIDKNEVAWLDVDSVINVGHIPRNAIKIYRITKGYEVYNAYNRWEIDYTFIPTAHHVLVHSFRKDE